MLVNLKELDLSFNYIERIENLDKLIERLRFLNNLKVLNLEGNPLAKQPDFSLAEYVAAILPQQTTDYYLSKLKCKHAYGNCLFEEVVPTPHLDHRLLPSTKALNTFDTAGYTNTVTKKRELRVIEADQEIELRARAQLAKEKQDAERLSLSFVEHLNEHQLYKSLWKGDEDGHTYDGGFPADDLAEEYDRDIFELTQEIYKLGLQNSKNVNRKLKSLIVEAIVLFQRRLQEMIAKLVEQAQPVFSQLRDVAVHFSENLNEIVNRYIATKLALQDFKDIPCELQNCMEDRETIANLVAGMKDYHTQRIDEREDRLMTRSKAFIDDMIDELNK
ncbi:Dynein regulatory complex subunit 3 [Eumeta japonica]|uniref:Dynein regulatory complex subunit 3 n=1 Tax=Eumeta variegata TaxID=151549 RepID=A0A4C1SRT9_EUMVA|nr:Dynein regulatory complex subunit 3 [Eumeta japonica]